MVRVFRFMAFLTAHPDTAPALANEQPVDGGDVAEQRSLCFQRISCRQCAAAGLCHSRAPSASAAFFYQGQCQDAP
ncbi:MAG: hypothetical protein ABSF34_14510, partial [Verrucomicrobiota bacterium]